MKKLFALAAIASTAMFVACGDDGDSSNSPKNGETSSSSETGDYSVSGHGSKINCRYAGDETSIIKTAGYGTSVALNDSLEFTFIRGESEDPITLASVYSTKFSDGDSTITIPADADTFTVTLYGVTSSQLSDMSKRFCVVASDEDEDSLDLVEIKNEVATCGYASTSDTSYKTVIDAGDYFTENVSIELQDDGSIVTVMEVNFGSKFSKDAKDNYIDICEAMGCSIDGNTVTAVDTFSKEEVKGLSLEEVAKQECEDELNESIEEIITVEKYGNDSIQCDAYVMGDTAMVIDYDAGESAQFTHYSIVGDSVYAQAIMSDVDMVNICETLKTDGALSCKVMSDNKVKYEMSGLKDELLQGMTLTALAEEVCKELTPAIEGDSEEE